jgi:hypothetical protein
MVLSMRRVVLREPFQGVQPAEPDRRLVAAKLVDSLGVKLGDPPLRCISLRGFHGSLALRQVRVLKIKSDLGRTLPAYCQEKSERGTGATGGGQPGTDGVNTCLRRDRRRQAAALHPQPPAHGSPHADDQDS